MYDSYDFVVKQRQDPPTLISTVPPSTSPEAQPSAHTPDAPLTPTPAVHQPPHTPEASPTFTPAIPPLSIHDPDVPPPTQTTAAPQATCTPEAPPPTPSTSHAPEVPPSTFIDNNDASNGK